MRGQCRHTHETQHEKAPNSGLSACKLRSSFCNTMPSLARLANQGELSIFRVFVERQPE